MVNIFSLSYKVALSLALERGLTLEQFNHLRSWGLIDDGSSGAGGGAALPPAPEEPSSQGTPEKPSSPVREREPAASSWESPSPASTPAGSVDGATAPARNVEPRYSSHWCRPVDGATTTAPARNVDGATSSSWERTPPTASSRESPPGTRMVDEDGGAPARRQRKMLKNKPLVLLTRSRVRDDRVTGPGYDPRTTAALNLDAPPRARHDTVPAAAAALDDG